MSSGLSRELINQGLNDYSKYNLVRKKLISKLVTVVFDARAPTNAKIPVSVISSELDSQSKSESSTRAGKPLQSQSNTLQYGQHLN